MRAAISELFRRQLVGQFVEPVIGGADRHQRYLRHMQSVDAHCQCLRFQPVAVACLARVVRLELGQFLPHPAGIGFAPAAFDIADDTFKRFLRLVGLRPSS